MPTCINLEDPISYHILIIRNQYKKNIEIYIHKPCSRLIREVYCLFCASETNQQKAITTHFKNGKQGRNRNAYKCLQSSRPNSGVRIITILLQNSQWLRSIGTHMTQLTNQLQALHPYSMVDIIDFLKNAINHILQTLR